MPGLGALSDCEVGRRVDVAGCGRRRLRNRPASLFRAEVVEGESATVDEWMAMLNDRLDETVAILDRERMGIEIVFRQRDGDDEYVYWIVVRGDSEHVATSTAHLCRWDGGRQRRERGRLRRGQAPRRCRNRGVRRSPCRGEQRRDPARPPPRQHERGRVGCRDQRAPEENVRTVATCGGALARAIEGRMALRAARRTGGRPERDRPGRPRAAGPAATPGWPDRAPRYLGQPDRREHDGRERVTTTRPTAARDRRTTGRRRRSSRRRPPSRR